MTFNECIIDRQIITLNVDVKTPQECIAKAVEPLIDMGLCTYEYYTSILENYQKLGAYFILTDGFAIPHTRPENGAKGIGFSLCTLKTPVAFDDSSDPIKVLIAFCTTDHDSHIEGIEAICDILLKENIIDSLWKAKTKEEIINLIQV